MSVLWALIGLEALYTRGHSGLRRQMLQGAEALLGPCLADRDAFSEMYTFRSDFAHGKVDFPYAHREGNSEEELAFENSRRKTASLAAALLVASLQELIVREWADVEFTVHPARP